MAVSDGQPRRRHEFSGIPPLPQFARKQQDYPLPPQLNQNAASFRIKTPKESERNEGKGFIILLLNQI